MKLKKWLIFLACVVIIVTSVPFVFAGSVKSESNADLPKDIDGNTWTDSIFAEWEDFRTKFDGSNRVIISYGGISLYGSELMDGKYPIVDEDKYEKYVQFANDNFGKPIVMRKIKLEEVQNMWTMEYHSTSSHADRYTICLSNGVTYLKDNTGSTVFSGADLTVTNDKSKATAWDLRTVKSESYTYYTFGHDISYDDPHFHVNKQKNGRYSLDLSRTNTSYFQLYVEMPWITTTFYNENGSEYKKDTRQINGFTVPSGPEKPGYTFLGWTTTKGGTNVVYKAGDTLTPTESKSYYPVYTVNKYTIRFYCDRTMSGDYTEQSFTYDQAQALTTNHYSVFSFRFLGWQNAADPSRTYQDGEVVKNLTATADGIVNLYGVWEENTYTVVYAANYGTGSAPPVTVKYTETFQLPSTQAFARDGYKLIGWNRKPDGSDVGFAPGQTVSKITEKDGETVTLYAIWEAVHTHTAGVWETTIPATCTDNGERVLKCIDCHAVLETETLVALGHKEGSVAVIAREASCSGTGEKVWYCERCGYITRAETVPPTEHIRGNYITVKTPTCSEDGIRQEVCSTCGMVIGEEKISGHTHTVGVWETTIPATCTDNGERVRKCSDCHAVLETETLAALGHKEGSCSIINMETSCNGMGEKVWYCERCGTPVKAEAVSAKGHKPGVAVTKFLPTCTADGIRITYCVNCSIILKEEKIPAHGHTDGCFITVKQPTCTEEGFMQQICSTCGVVTAEKSIPANGHSGTLWVTTVEPTCTRTGEKVLKCTSCGNSIKVETTAALGHTAGTIKTCADGATCEVCGIAMEKADGSSHTWTAWKSYKQASFFANGWERRSCTTCGDEESRIIHNSATWRRYIAAICIGAAILIIGGGVITVTTVVRRKRKHSR